MKNDMNLKEKTQKDLKNQGVEHSFKKKIQNLGAGQFKKVDIF